MELYLDTSLSAGEFRDMPVPLLRVPFDLYFINCPRDCPERVSVGLYVGGVFVGSVLNVPVERGLARVLVDLDESVLRGLFAKERRVRARFEIVGDSRVWLRKFYLSSSWV